MKRLITSLLIAAMLLSFGACDKKEDNNKVDDSTKVTETSEESKATKNEETSDISDTETTAEVPEESETEENTESEEETTYWIVSSYVDEFGDPTGNYGLQGYFSDGNYSDSFTSYGNLFVRMVYDPERNYFEANLFEKNEHQMTSVSHFSGSDMRFLYKIGEEKYETDDVMVLDSTGPMAIDFEGRDSVADNIITALRNGEDVTCIMYIDSAKYNFTMYANGFTEAEAEAELKVLDE